MIITIDGPTASGKSSIAKKLASALHIHCLNTGLLYRAAAYLLREKYGTTLLHDSCFGPFKIGTEALALVDTIQYEYSNGEPRVFHAHHDITDQLYTDEISQFASIVSSCKELRAYLLPVQRRVAQEYDVVADGRDCGTVVFPDADFKFFLTASVEVRAQRRCDQLKKMGFDVDCEDVSKNLKERDERDKHREIAPLVVPHDAVIIDNSDMTFEETIAAFISVIEQ